MVDLVRIFRKVQNLWDSLELRVLVLVSLFIQFVLIAAGNRRKYIKKKWLSGVLWLFYLSADSIATLSLSVLSQSQSDATESLIGPRYTIMAFWAPFLLMHLGGPDTITAYALADNELWARHFLGLATQVGIAVIVLFRSWSGEHLNYLWMVIFVAGFVKYGERTLVLYSASKDQFRESLVTDPDPGPNYAKFMDELVLKELEGYDVSLVKAIDTIPSSTGPNDPGENVAYEREGVDQEDAVLQQAYSFFGTFKKLFADLILSFQDKEDSLLIFRDDEMNWDKAFRIVEVELGLVYDLFYTKASLLHCWYGFPLRALSFLSTVAANVVFLAMDKGVYPDTEVVITYILLLGAIFLEFYADLILLSSDWVMIWLTGDWTIIRASRKFKELVVLSTRGFVSGLRKLHVVPARMRWSNAMGQYNVLNHCIEGKKKCIKVRKFLQRYFWKSAGVPNGLKALIFDELKERLKGTDDDKKLDSSKVDKASGSYRGDNKSGSYKVDKASGSYRGDKKLLEEINGSPKDDKDHNIDHKTEFVQTKDDKDHNIDHEVEFDQSLLLWHLATDFCYYREVKKEDEPDEGWLHKFNINEEPSAQDKVKFKREICKLLSNYMMHLLIMSPFMLPSGIGQIRFQDTCAEATEFFNKKKLDKRDACEKLRRVDTRLAPLNVKGDRSKSLLFDACKLANALQSFGDGEKWEKITKAWLYLLTYAAAQCSWSDHAEKLSQGGELLTHVWLLMAHFGMTDHFQISQGYVRAKLQLA